MYVIISFFFPVFINVGEKKGDLHAINVEVFSINRRKK